MVGEPGSDLPGAETRAGRGTEKQAAGKGNNHNGTKATEDIHPVFFVLVVKFI